MCVCASVSVCERVREEGTFSSKQPAAFAFTVENTPPNLFGFLQEIRGERTVVCFSTADLCFFLHVLACMYAGTHENQRTAAGEWDVEWLTTRMDLSERLL